MWGNIFLIFEGESLFKYILQTRIKTTGRLTAKVKICTAREATNTVKRHHGMTKKSLCKSCLRRKGRHPYHTGS